MATSMPVNTLETKSMDSVCTTLLMVTAMKAHGTREGDRASEHTGSGMVKHDLVSGTMAF